MKYFIWFHEQILLEYLLYARMVVNKRHNDSPAPLRTYSMDVITRVKGEVGGPKLTPSLRSECLQGVVFRQYSYLAKFKSIWMAERSLLWAQKTIHCLCQRRLFWPPFPSPWGLTPLCRRSHLQTSVFWGNIYFSFYNGRKQTSENTSEMIRPDYNYINMISLPEDPLNFIWD